MKRHKFRAYYSTTSGKDDRRAMERRLKDAGLDTKEIAPLVWWDEERSDMIKAIPHGSVVVVPAIDRLAWPEKELRRVLGQLHAKGCTLEIDGEPYDLALSGMIDRVAREKAREQTGRARAAGGTGPKPKLTLRKAERIAAEFARQDPPITYDAWAARHGISRATAFRWIGTAREIMDAKGLPAHKAAEFKAKQK